jgi:hypothetical protein
MMMLSWGRRHYTLSRSSALNLDCQLNVAIILRRFNKYEINTNLSLFIELHYEQRE